MYHLLSTQVSVPGVDASDPQVASAVLDAAERTMSARASERSRHLIERPRLVSAESDPFGFVTLTFDADTEDD